MSLLEHGVHYSVDSLSTLREIPFVPLSVFYGQRRLSDVLIGESGDVGIPTRYIVAHEGSGKSYISRRVEETLRLPRYVGTVPDHNEPDQLVLVDEATRLAPPRLIHINRSSIFFVHAFSAVKSRLDVSPTELRLYRIPPLSINESEEMFDLYLGKYSEKILDRESLLSKVQNISGGNPGLMHQLLMFVEMKIILDKSYNNIEGFISGKDRDGGFLPINLQLLRARSTKPQNACLNALLQNKVVKIGTIGASRVSLRYLEWFSFARPLSDDESDGYTLNQMAYRHL